MNPGRQAYGRQDTSAQFPAYIPANRQDSRRRSTAGRKQKLRSGTLLSGDSAQEKAMFRRADILQTKRLPDQYALQEKRRFSFAKNISENKEVPRLSPRQPLP